MRPSTPPDKCEAPRDRRCRSRLTRGNMLRFQSVKLSHLILDLLADQRILRKIRLRILTSLTDLRSLISVPGSTLLNNIRICSQIKNIALAGDSLSEHNIKLSLFKWRSNLIFYNFYTYMVTDHLTALL